MAPSKAAPYLGPALTLALALVAGAVVWGGTSERVKRLDQGLDRLEQISRDHAKDHAALTGTMADHGARLGALERSALLRRP